jgi:hypothetical protein
MARQVCQIRRKVHASEVAGQVGVVREARAIVWNAIKVSSFGAGVA